LKKFESEWLAFRAKVIPAQATDSQVRAMKLAFYAGASSVITLLGLLFDLTTGVEPTEEDCKVLENVWKELNEYFKDEMMQSVKEGKN
jgi:hypothetical protein